MIVVQLRSLAIAGALAAILSACADDVRPVIGRAGPPDSVLPRQGAAAAAPVASQQMPIEVPVDPEAESGNRQIAAFLRDNIEQMRKYPHALRIATVVGPREMDLTKWPGTVVVDELRKQARTCGTPVAFVGLNDDFDMLVGFSRQEKDGRLDEEDRLKISGALTRNRLRAAQSLADILDTELEVKIDSDRATTKGLYPFDRWHRFLSYEVPQTANWALLPRLPVETWREHFDKVVAEIDPKAPDSENKRTRVTEFRTRYLDEVMAICPTNFFATLINRASLNTSPDLIMDVLRDDRVTAGMKREQFAEASLIVLNALRPGK